MSFGLHSEEIKTAGGATSEQIINRSNIMNNKLKKIFEETGYEYYLSSNTDDNYIYLNNELTLGFCIIDSGVSNSEVYGLVDLQIKKEDNIFLFPLQYFPVSTGSASYGFCFNDITSSNDNPAYDFVYKISKNKKALIIGINALAKNSVRKDFLPFIFTKDQNGNNAIVCIYGTLRTSANNYITYNNYTDLTEHSSSGYIAVITDKQDIGYGVDSGYLNTFRTEPTAPTTMIRMPTLYSDSYFPDIYYILSTPSFTNNLSNIIAIEDKRYQICYGPGSTYGPLLAVEVGDD